MKCRCIAKLNDALATENTAVDVATTFNFDTGKSNTYFQIATVKIDTKKRKAKRKVLCAYCPVCGKRAS